MQYKDRDTNLDKFDKMLKLIIFIFYNMVKQNTEKLKINDILKIKKIFSSNKLLFFVPKIKN